MLLALESWWGTLPVPLVFAFPVLRTLSEGWRRQVEIHVDETVQGQMFGVKQQLLWVLLLW